MATELRLPEFDDPFWETPEGRLLLDMEDDEVMVRTITFTVPAVPVAQPRVKATIRGKHAGVYTPQTIGGKENRRPHPIHAFKATVRMAAQEAYQGPPLTGPLVIDCVFVFPRESNKFWKTKPTPRYPHTVKPDRDNCDKAILDSLKGTVIADDATVFDGRITKWRAAGDEQPHCEIAITELAAE